MTALYGQTGDSLTCYTNSELQKISKKLVYANECDTLLKITEAQLEQTTIANKELKNTLFAKDQVLTQRDEVIVLQQEIISQRENTVADLTKSNTKLKRQKKFLKAGFATSGTLLLGAIAFIWITN